MRVSKRLILSVLIAMGLGLQWLQGQSSQSGNELNKQSAFVFEDFEPFARTAQDTSNDKNASPRFAAHRMQRLKGRVATHSLELKETQDSPQESINLGTSPEEEGVAAKEKTEKDGDESEEESDEEKEIVGYDDEGNPIYKEESDGEEAEDAEIIADTKVEDVHEKKEKKAEPTETPQDTTYVTGAAPLEEEDKEEDEAKESYDKWAQLILGQANYAEVSKLIEQYQTGRISKEVFYGLVNELLADNRFEMQKLGVLAAGLTPSKDSFLLLADFSGRLAYGSDLRADVDNFLGQYATLTYLHVLESVLLSSSDSVSNFAVLVAATQLDKAARFYMNQPLPDEGTSSQDLEPTAAQLQFSRFIGILEEFIEFSPDAEARIVAQQTLTSIKSLIEG